MPLSLRLQGLGRWTKHSRQLLILTPSYWPFGCATKDHVLRATVQFVAKEMISITTKEMMRITTKEMTRMTMMEEIMINPVRREGGWFHQNRLPNLTKHDPIPANSILTKHINPLPTNSVLTKHINSLPPNSVPQIAQYEPQHGIFPERGTEAANRRHLLPTIDLYRTVTAKGTLLLSVQQT